MAAKKYPTPNLANMTETGLVEIIKEYRVKMAEAKYYDGFYSEALKARRNGRKEIMGEKHCIEFTDVKQERFDTTQLKADAAAGDKTAQAMVKKYIKEVSMSQIRFKENVSIATAAEAVKAASGKTPDSLLKQEGKGK